MEGKPGKGFREFQAGPIRQRAEKRLQCAQEAVFKPVLQRDAFCSVWIHLAGTLRERLFEGEEGRPL